MRLYGALLSVVYIFGLVSVDVVRISAEELEQLKSEIQDQIREQGSQQTEVLTVDSIRKTKTGVIIPYYRDQPHEVWDAIINAKNAYPEVPMIVIVNPHNGPGDYKDQDYVLQIQRLQSAGILVLGYIYTDYAKRSNSSIYADIRAYKSWYNINGIVFDEMSNKPGHESYYKSLSDYAKYEGLNFTIGNPGTDTLESYIGTVDNIIIYENNSLPSIQYLDDSWYSKYDKKNFSMLSTGINELNTMYVGAATNYVGYMYITNDDLPNPWDSLTHYFNELVASVDEANKLSKVILEAIANTTSATIDEANILSKVILEAIANTTSATITNATTANTTLGKLFYEERTKSIGIRVTDVIHGPEVEVSFAGNGTINGTMNVTDIGTIWIVPTNPIGNMIYGEGQGILTTTQEGEMAIYTQQAIGQITPGGKVVFHGSMFFKTLSPTGKLSFLNNLMGIYNYESDLAGNAVRKVWDWR
jgi:hypothetical protein